MSTPQRDIDRLLALLDGRLEGKARARLEARIEREPELREAKRRLAATRALMREISEAEPPEVPFKQIEAQARWRAAQEEERLAARRERRRPWRMALAMAAMLTVGIAAGVLLDRTFGPAPRAVQPPAVAKTLAKAPATPTVSSKATTPQSAARELAALAVLSSGEVTVAPSGASSTRLELNRPLLPGDRVLTGSHGLVTLQWESGTGVQLGESGELVLRKLTSTHQEVALYSGRAAFEVKPGQKRRFTVLSGNLRVEVVGTRFSVWAGREATEVEVYQGKVLAFPHDPKKGAKAQGTPRGIAITAGQRLRVPRQGLLVRDGKSPLQALQKNKQRGPRLFLAKWPDLARVLASTSLLRVESQPAGAELRFDTRPVGTTNLRLRGSHGRHLLELWRGGKLLRRHWVEIGPGKRARVALRLDTVRVRRPTAAPRLPTSLYSLIRRRSVLIRACYERRLKRRPKLAGKLELQLEIAADGRVTRASVDRDTLSDPGVGQCAVAVVKRWRFPAGNAVTLVYPFVFRPR